MNEGLFLVSGLLLTCLAVLGLYLMSPPRMRQVVPSIIIWEKVFFKRKREIRLLRWLISFLMAVLIAVLLAITGMAEKFGGFIGLDSKIIILIDNSPSMASINSRGNSRFQEGVNSARELIEGFDRGARIMVVDTQKTVASPQYDYSAEAIRVLENLKIEKSALSNGLTPETYNFVSANDYFFVTDGVSVPQLLSPWKVISVFEEIQNVGITDFVIDSSPGDLERHTAYLHVVNSGDNSQDVELTLRGIGGSKLTKSFTIEPSGVKRQFLDVSSFDEGPITSRVKMKDDNFPLDDVAFAFRKTTKTVRIGLVSEGNKFLEPLLGDYPGAHVKLFPPSDFVYSNNIDFYIFDGFAPPEVPRVPTFLINTHLQSWLPKLRKVGNPTLEDQIGSHPIVDGVALDDVAVDEAWKTRVSGSVDIPLIMTSGEAVSVAHNATPRWVWLGFDLNDSNFGLLPGFPIFLDNLMHWLLEEETVNYSNLGPVKVHFDAEKGLGVNGESLAFTKTNSGSIQFLAENPGIYTLQKGGDQMKVIVNGFSDGFSYVNQSWSEPNLTASPLNQGTWSTIWSDKILLILLIVFIAVVIEWITFNLRKTV